MGSGCAAAGRGSEPHQHWTGQPAAELVARWGQPAAVARTGQGCWTLEFHRSWRSHAPGYGYVPAGSGGVGVAGSARAAGAGVGAAPLPVNSRVQGGAFPIGLSCRAQVAVDSDGRVVRIETQGKASRSMA
jgi:hypothetical protein